MALEEWPRGSKGNKPPSKLLAYDSVGECVEEYVANRLAKGAMVFGFGSYATIKIGPQCMSKVIVVHVRFAPTHVHLGPQLHYQLPLARGSV